MRYVWIGVLCGLALTSPARAADPEDANVTEARALYEKGSVLGQQSRWADALAAFERSFKLRPHAATIYNVAQCFRATGQYARARAHLGGGALGFAWAREWPASWPGPDDVDSGPTIPLLGANAGASGLALVGAAAFGDRAYLDDLLASLMIGGFPIESDGALRFAAGNQLADAVIAYALSTGPLWQRAAELGRAVAPRPRDAAPPRPAPAGGAS